MSDLSGRTTVVVGASRGLGRGIASAFAEAGAPVVALARTGSALAELAATNANIRAEVADAADPTVAWNVLDQYEPEVLILVAGANPVMRPLQHQTWETFSVNWHTDVKIAFTWLREALLKPLPPGSKVVVISSGAAISGSPASGGYAGSKATQRFLASYAQDEAHRAGPELPSGPEPLTQALVIVLREAAVKLGLTPVVSLPTGPPAIPSSAPARDVTSRSRPSGVR